ncbi:MAG: hypothetical protein AAB587_01185 [Patescibacteria group bacterium]
MSKTVLMYIVGAVVVVGGAGVAVIMSKSPDQAGTPAALQDSVQTAREAGSGMATGKMSMKDLMVSGIAQKCTVDFTTDSSQSSGTVYVANGKTRTDFDTTASGVSVKNHMIVDGVTSYVWTSLSNQGMKIVVDTSVSKTSMSNRGLDYNQALGYQCSPWTVDASMFVLPKGVTFTDLSSMMESLPEIPSSY